MKKKAVLLIILIALTLIFTSCNSVPNAVFGDIAITEVCSSNRSSLVLSDGTAPDWVEIKNLSNHEVSLNGCGLTDNVKKPYKYRFTDTVLNPGEYALVYCVGADSEAEESGNFAKLGISKSGEQLFFFFSSKGNSISVNVPELIEDVSYGLTDDGSYGFFNEPTPGRDNVGEHTDELFSSDAVERRLIINEYMAENDYSIQNGFGKRTSWVEIKNISNESVELSDYYLSDDSSDALNWRFPNKSMAPGELTLIWLSGEDTVTENGEIHASFKLSEDDEAIVISAKNGMTVDKMEQLYINNGRSSTGRAENGSDWLYYSVATPGKENQSGYNTKEEAESYLPEIYISEVSAISADEADWIEISNRSSNTVDITGFGLSDDADDIYKYKFDERQISAGEYIVIEDVFGISANTETVYLSDASGNIVDSLITGVLRESVSAGKTSDSDERCFYTEKTKGTTNSTDCIKGYSAEPVFSKVGGYTDAGTVIEISTSRNAKIYYTLDGSKPTNDSIEYTSPITVDKTSCIRAIAYEDGKLPSKVVTENYLVGISHQVPVVCVDIAPEDFMGSSRGIYAKGNNYDGNTIGGILHKGANYWQDWEREINFTFYEKDGTKGISFDAGMKIFGQYSRELDQKSFSIFLRSKYGQKYATYPIFRDSEVTTFKSFLLRTSGQDWGNTKLFDAMIAQTVKGYTNVDIMEYRPCVVYINGEYFGIYNVREKMNDNYIVSHNENVDKDTVTIVKSDSTTKGDSKLWRELRDYVKKRLPEGSLSDEINSEEFMNYVEERVDVSSLIDWMCIEAIFANSDTSNVRQYTYDGGKWRWMLFDMDLSFRGLEENYNYLKRLINPEGYGSGLSSHMHRMIFSNQTYRKQFVERYAYLLNNVITVDRMCTIIDAMAAEIRPEIPMQCERWNEPSSLERWESNISSLKAKAEKRHSQAIDNLQDACGLSNERMRELFPNR